MVHVDVGFVCSLSATETQFTKLSMNNSYPDNASRVGLKVVNEASKDRLL